MNPEKCKALVDKIDELRATISQNEILDDEKRLIHCPVCGEIVEMDDICETCNWQNTGSFNVDGGPNKMTLAEAKKAWADGKPIE